MGGRSIAMVRNTTTTRRQYSKEDSVPIETLISRHTRVHRPPNQIPTYLPCKIPSLAAVPRSPRAGCQASVADHTDLAVHRLARRGSFSATHPHFMRTL